MQNQTLQIKTPRWCLPLLDHKRYKGAKGGRGSGKSHFWAELLVEEHVANVNQQSVCIREVQKSLKFSAKKLIEDKIFALGVSHLFEVTINEIRRRDGRGIIIFQGMQDHTADSIKSLEGFSRAWVEEAQSISKRSMALLLPTIRAPDSELWFSWNPENDNDPVEELFKTESEDSTCVHVNYLDNPFLPDTLKKEAERHRRNSYDSFDHVWLGMFNTRSDAQIFANKFKIEHFDVDETYGAPLFGLDFGFANDPTAGVCVYIKSNILYIRYDAGRTGLELDDTAGYLIERIPGVKNHTIRADNARPESISYLKRSGLPRIISCEKGKGSVLDGIEFIKSFDGIIIHPEAKDVAKEFRLYSYKVDRRTDDILPDIEDDNNHWIDALRYALEPIMKASKAAKGVRVGR